MLRAGSRFVALTLYNDEIGLYRGDETQLNEWLSSDLALTQLRWMPSPEPGIQRDAADIQRHLSKVDQVLGELLRNSEIPLVLLGEQRLQTVYRDINTHGGPLLLTPGVHTGELSRAQIRRLACAATRVELRREEDAALESYSALRGSGRTVTNAEPLLTAADRGAVETLLISTNATSWASQVSTPSVLNLRDSPTASYSVEVATAAALRHSGSVLTVAPDRMPDGALMAAALRY